MIVSLLLLFSLFFFRLPAGFLLDRRVQLEWEKELMGMYVSDHPISPYLPLIRLKASHCSKDLAEADDNQKVSVAGMVTRIRTTMTKKGDQMAFATIEDLQGGVELVIFPRAWEKMGALVKMESVILVEGKMDSKQSEPKLLVDVIKTLREEDIPAYEEPARETPDLQNAGADTWQTDIDTMHYTQRGNGYEEPPLSEEETSWQGSPLPAEIETDSSPGDEFPAKDTEVDTQPQNSIPAASVETLSVEPSAAEPPAQDYIKPPVIIAPMVRLLNTVDSSEIRLVTVTLKSSGEKDRDVRRMRQVHGVLNSFPGRDRFCFMVYERGFRHLLDFPNYTTNASNELVSQLAELVGRENIQIENI